MLACSGAAYLPLAIYTARSVAATNPGLPIDLYTDEGDVRDPVFDRVHPLETAWFRPKFEAMRRSRFARTLYLDTDLRVLADISDLFDLLERYEIAGAFDAYRASRKAVPDPERPIPAAFPQINSGVLVLRTGARTGALMRAVEDRLRASGARKDQPLLREELWRSDLALGILPEEYNLMAYRHAALWSDRYAAPRIVHNSRFSSLGDGGLEALAGRRLARHIGRLIAADPTLPRQGTAPSPPGGARRRILPLADRTPGAALSRLADKLRLALRSRRR